MNQSRADLHRRAKAIFDEICDLPQTEQSARLEATRAAEPPLFQALHRYLEIDAATKGGTLDSPLIKLVAGDHGEPEATIGPYRLVSKLGSGGFGDVWLAEQAEPIRRTVALKLIRPGMDSESVIARFEQERQALAVMDHPNVAKVIDAGVTPAGRPFFVMEHVPGESITDFCNRHNYTIRQRLELFIPVCEAVQHAHMKGIIHRDIKPSNILVMMRDGQAVPKVIDFGVAKAIEHTLTEKTVFTEVGQLIGTPEYMSPEQASMGELDIDTRTDVYSLGVLLYELLTGLLPFDSNELRHKGYAEIQRIIREVEPPTPTKRLATDFNLHFATLSAALRAERQSIVRQLRRELEWIPLRAMRKDRSRRYASPADLASDVQRFLVGGALEAGPETIGYAVRKFASRNRGPVLALVASFSALFVGLGLALMQWNAATRQATLAQERANAEALARVRSEDIRKFLIETLKASDPDTGGSQAATVVEAMQRATIDLKKGAFGQDLETRSQLLDSISSILQNNGKSVEAEPLAQEALDLALRVYPTNGPAIPLVRLRVASILRENGKLSEAEQMCRDALELALRLHDDQHPDVIDCLHSLAGVLRALGNVPEAERVALQALERQRRRCPGDHVDTLAALNTAASLRVAGGHLNEAEPLFIEAAEMSQRLFEGDHPDVAGSLKNLASLDLWLGRYADAERLHSRALEMRIRLFQGDHPDVAQSLVSVASARRFLGRVAESELLLRQAVDMYRRLRGNSHSDVAETLVTLAGVQSSLGCEGEAELTIDEALTTLRRLFRNDHPEVAKALSQRGRLHAANRHLPQAEVDYREAVDMNVRLFPGDHPEVATNLNNLASVLSALSRPADAEPLYEEAVEMAGRVFKGDHLNVAKYLENLANVRHTLGKTAEARQSFDATVEMLRRLSPRGSPELARALWKSGSARLANRDIVGALWELSDAVAMAEVRLPATHPQLREYRDALARCKALLRQMQRSE